MNNVAVIMQRAVACVDSTATVRASWMGNFACCAGEGGLIPRGQPLAVTPRRAVYGIEACSGAVQSSITPPPCPAGLWPFRYLAGRIADQTAWIITICRIGPRTPEGCNFGTVAAIEGLCELYKIAWHEAFTCGWAAHPSPIRARARRAQSGPTSGPAVARQHTSSRTARRPQMRGRRMESGSAAVFMDEPPSTPTRSIGPSAFSAAVSRSGTGAGMSRPRPRCGRAVL
jgi:hypothetical protein